jgi:hypothetical protein
MAGAGADERESLSAELRVHKELTERFSAGTPSPASLRSFSILVDRKRSGRCLVIAGGGKEPIEIGLRAQPYRDGDEFGDIVGVEFAQAQFDRGKKVCARLDEHQGFGGGFDRSLPSIDRMDIVNDIDAGCELLGDESGRDATGFLW